MFIRSTKDIFSRGEILTNRHGKLVVLGRTPRKDIVEYECEYVDIVEGGRSALEKLTYVLGLPWWKFLWLRFRKKL